MALLLAGEKKNIEIKKNRIGFEFGLNMGSLQTQQVYLATMFDAQEVDKGKLIQVSRESSGYKASILLTVGTEHQLTNTRTKTYREEDRINRKYKIDKAIEAAEVATGAIPGQ